MNLDRTLDDYIDTIVFNKISLVIERQSFNFVTQALSVGLNPARDFRHSDLRGVCFDNCDLSGFNFSGADLRGSHGLSVKFDKTTVFEGAKAENSIFAQETRKRAFFGINPEHHAEYRRMVTAYWTETISWVDERLKPHSPDRSASVEIAKAIFDETGDPVVRSNILLFISRGFDEPEAHRDFVISIISRNTHDPRIMRTAVRALSDLYKDESYAYQFLKTIHSNAEIDQDVRDSAAMGVCRSALFLNDWRDAVANAEAFPASARRVMLGRIALQRGKRFAQSVLEPIGNQPIDFGEPITDRKIFEMARRHLRDFNAKANAGRLANQPLGDPKEGQIAALSVRLRENLKELQGLGVPFAFAEANPASQS